MLSRPGFIYRHSCRPPSTLHRQLHLQICWWHVLGSAGRQLEFATAGNNSHSSVGSYKQFEAELLQIKRDHLRRTWQARQFCWSTAAIYERRTRQQSESSLCHCYWSVISSQPRDQRTGVVQQSLARSETEDSPLPWYPRRVTAKCQATVIAKLMYCAPAWSGPQVDVPLPTVSS